MGIKNTVKTKTAFLGMNYGTACSKLRKEILFDYVKKAGNDICFRCGKRIESVREFSIEHKKAWLHEDAGLFWALENIAFSHLRCNSKVRRANYTQKIIVPEGTARCFSCKRNLPKSAFGSARQQKGRNRDVRGYCNECRKNSGWKK